MWSIISHLFLEVRRQRVNCVKSSCCVSFTQAIPTVDWKESNYRSPELHTSQRRKVVIMQPTEDKGIFTSCCHKSDQIEQRASDISTNLTIIKNIWTRKQKYSSRHLLFLLLLHFIANFYKGVIFQSWFQQCSWTKTSTVHSKKAM